MPYKSHRRDFLKNTVKGSMAISIGMSAISPFIESCTSTHNIVSSPYKTGFDQQPLPYAFNALENVIDGTTMEIHYTKHAATYSKNLKEAVVAEKVDSKNSLEDVLANISKYSAKMRNNGGGHYNREMFWQCMREKQNEKKPTGK